MDEITKKVLKDADDRHNTISFMEVSDVIRKWPSFTEHRNAKKPFVILFGEDGADSEMQTCLICKAQKRELSKFEARMDNLKHLPEETRNLEFPITLYIEPFREMQVGSIYLLIKYVETMPDNVNIVMASDTAEMPAALTGSASCVWMSRPSNNDLRGVMTIDEQVTGTEKVLSSYTQLNRLREMERLAEIGHLKLMADFEDLYKMLRKGRVEVPDAAGRIMAFAHPEKGINFLPYLGKYMLDRAIRDSVDRPIRSMLLGLATMLVNAAGMDRIMRYLEES